MAFLLPNLSPSPSQNPPSRPSPPPPPPPPPSPLINLTLPNVKQQQLHHHHHHHHHQTTTNKNKHNNNKNDFYLNLGVAVRTLRSDLPSLFSRDLDYQIYRDDITFTDPLNTFHGIDNYKLIFWALRFHGRILFREISLEIFRVWQPSETSILIRWELRGVPRVPWEARGQFQGTSRYKVDREGKIYEHKIDNLAFNFPRGVRPVTVMDLVAAACPPATPNLTFRWEPVEDVEACSWVELYRAVRGTLEREERGMVGAGIEGLVICS